MGRRRTFEMEEALAIATRLFWRGYDRTSLAELTGAMGIAPASFYFAFSSKETLFRQVVERYLESLADDFDRAFQAPTTGGGVKALLRRYVDVVTDSDHPPGCLVVNNSPSVDGEPVRRWLADLRTALRVRLQERFCADLAAGKLPDNFDPGTMARFVVTVAGGLAVEAEGGAHRQDLYAAIDLALSGFPGGEGDHRPAAVK